MIRIHFLYATRKTLAAPLMFAVFLLAGCSKGAFTATDNLNNLELKPSECKLVRSTSKPDGSELSISARRISSNEFLVKIKNISKLKVFVAYTPKEGINVGFVSFLAEKRNQAGDFVPQRTELDFSPGLHGIDAGQEIEFNFFETQKGDFRLVISYMINERMVAILNDPNCLFKIAQTDRQYIAEAKGQAISPILKITKRIPTRNR